MKKFEENKAKVVEVLTALSDAINDAATTDDIIKLADALGARVPDAIDLDRRKRVLYIGLACDILRFINLD